MQWQLAEFEVGKETEPIRGWNLLKQEKSAWKQNETINAEYLNLFLLKKGLIYLRSALSNIRQNINLKKIQ